jgi:tripartite-type tricarboxylate transporter receptor subunit TctC
MFIKALSAALLAVMPLAAFGQFSSDRPVTIVVPFSAGGPTDVVARRLAIALTTTLGRTVIVENKASAGGIVGTQGVARAEPDGNTLLMHNIGMSTSPSLYRKLPFNPLTDFEYIGQVVDVPMTLVGRKSLPANDLKELLAYIGANRQKINYAHAGLGTASHLCGLLFMSRTELPMTTIAYKGAAPALTDVQGGHVDLICDQTSTTAQLIKNDRVKVYGATSLQRLPVLPNVPTLAEQGLSNFEISVWHGLYAPKGTPKPVIDRLSKALQDALVTPPFKQAMDELGINIVSREKATPEGLRHHLEAEVKRWAPIIQAAKAYAD